MARRSPRRPKRWPSESGRQFHTIDRTGISYVSISCYGTPLNPHPTWNIASFWCGKDLIWTELSTGFIPAEGDEVLPRGPRVFEWIDGEKWLSARSGIAEESISSPELRRRGKFVCKYGCFQDGAFAPPVIRWERWERELEKLRLSGVSHMQLWQLAGILRNV